MFCDCGLIRWSFVRGGRHMRRYDLIQHRMTIVDIASLFAHLTLPFILLMTNTIQYIHTNAHLMRWRRTAQIDGIVRLNIRYCGVFLRDGKVKKKISTINATSTTTYTHKRTNTSESYRKLNTTRVSQIVNVSNFKKIANFLHISHMHFESKKIIIKLFTFYFENQQLKESSKRDMYTFQ